MDPAPLVGLIICILSVIFLCVVVFTAYVFVKIFKHMRVVRKTFNDRR